MDKLFFRRDISIVYAEAGIGKSWFIASIAAVACCGTGISERFSVSKPVSTLIINGEMRDDELNQRDAVLTKLCPHDSGKCFYQSIRATKQLDTPEGLTYLKEAIRQCNRLHPNYNPISLVILDSLKTLTHSGESKGNWASLFQCLDQLRSENAITFIIIQHENKSGEQYGTIDQNIKGNGDFHLTRNTENITATDPGDKFKIPKKYQEFLRRKLMQWREDHPNDIWFFLIPPKGRSTIPQDKCPVMLHFCPEDNPPRWQCIDFLAKDHPWSLHAFRTSEGDTSRMPNEQRAEESPKGKDNQVPNYRDLLKRSKEEVISWLQKAKSETGSSRKDWGSFFEVSKNQIDYLMELNGIINDDIQ